MTFDRPLDATWEEDSMRNHRINEVRPEVVKSTSARRSRILRPTLLRVVQLGAIVVSTATFGLALGTSHTVSQLAFSSDGRMLIGTVNGYIWPKWNQPMFMYGVIKVWDAGTGETLARLPGPGTWLRALAVSSDGSTLAVAGDTPLIELWDLVRGTKKGVLAEHSGDVTQLAFAPSGELLASASIDGQVRLWDVATRQTRIALQVDEYGAYGLLFAPDGRTLATNDANGVRFWDTNDGHLVNQLDGWRESSDQRRYSLGFLGFSGAGKDSILTRHEGHHGEVAAVINGATQVERFVFNSRRRLCMKLSPNSRVIAIGDRAGTVSILDATSGRPLLPAEGLKGEVRCLAFSPNGTLLAGGDDGERVRVWETNTGRLRTSFSSGDPIRRWGPTATAILVLAATTIRLRSERGKPLPNQGDPHPGGAAAQK